MITPVSVTPFCPLTMVNLSRWQTMHTSCWVSGTQSLRAGGCSGGWNLADEPRLLPAELRSFSLSVLFEEGVCVGVLPVIKHKKGKQSDKIKKNTSLKPGTLINSSALNLTLNSHQICHSKKKLTCISIN